MSAFVLLISGPHTHPGTACQDGLISTLFWSPCAQIIFLLLLCSLSRGNWLTGYVSWVSSMVLAGFDQWDTEASDGDMEEGDEKPSSPSLRLPVSGNVSGNSFCLPRTPWSELLPGDLTVCHQEPGPPCFLLLPSIPAWLLSNTVLCAINHLHDFPSSINTFSPPDSLVGACFRARTNSAAALSYGDDENPELM